MKMLCVFAALFFMSFANAEDTMTATGASTPAAKEKKEGAGEMRQHAAPGKTAKQNKRARRHDHPKFDPMTRGA